MHQNDSPLVSPKTGVLFVSGFEPSLRVQRRHLIVRTVVGRDLREARLSKVARPRLRRLVVFGTGGYTTWEALAWLDGIGATFLHLSRSGRTIAASGELGPDQPALRRAQVLAEGNVTGLEVVRLLMGPKLDGQRAVLCDHLPAEQTALEMLDRAIEHAAKVGDVRAVLAWEAKAAAAYWGAWANVGVDFARADLPGVPEHWLLCGERHSLLSSSPRLAVTPVGAILNYLYALAEFECRLALLAVGLDPGLGWAHRDAPYRDSAALDLLEAIRPKVDRYLIELLRDRTFSRREFVELPTGHVRLAPALARLLSESTLIRWEQAVRPVAEEVARLIASSAPSPVRVRTRLTQADRRRGRTQASVRRGSRISSACRMCGLVLDNPDRMYCDECLPIFDAERTQKLATAGKQTLARMRASSNDPARSPEARAKRSVAASRREAERRAWSREHAPELDPGRYERDILPLILKTGTAELARRTGLSNHYCWQIRKGTKRLHQRHWEALLSSAPR